MHECIQSITPGNEIYYIYVRIKTRNTRNNLRWLNLSLIFYFSKFELIWFGLHLWKLTWQHSAYYASYFVTRISWTESSAHALSLVGCWLLTRRPLHTDHDRHTQYRQCRHCLCVLCASLEASARIIKGATSCRCSLQLCKVAFRNILSKLSCTELQSSRISVFFHVSNWLGFFLCKFHLFWLHLTF